MIRINLIYDRKAIEVGKVKNELVIGGILIGVMILIISFVWVGKNGSIETLALEKGKLEQTKNGLNAISKKIKEFKKTKTELGNIIAAIETLHKRQQGPTRIFDEINKRLSNEVWLTSLSEKGQKIKVEGYSFTDPGIAAFMKNLNEAKYFSGVELLRINQQMASGSTEQIKKFSLNLTVADQI